MDAAHVILIAFVLFVLFVLFTAYFLKSSIVINSNGDESKKREVLSDGIMEDPDAE
ncbi:hypothetical protein [Methanolobus psychrotolerans]|uniref:hypothetical protein n=1 Tax=Methanolobus psychrotolerans TaxID=1874706 RepID=UPI0013EBD6D6|nr:hypothetical protein [Methanolobus psychrotolerans]